MTISMQMAIFWDVSPCSLVDTDTWSHRWQRQLWSHETVSVYQVTWCHILKNYHLRKGWFSDNSQTGNISKRKWKKWYEYDWSKSFRVTIPKLYVPQLLVQASSNKLHQNIWSCLQNATWIDVTSVCTACKQHIVNLTNFSQATAKCYDTSWETKFTGW